ncbi:MAG: hypothetical protein ACRDGB_06330, partial [Candidatus Limnocylindria bacterium]
MDPCGGPISDGGEIPSGATNWRSFVRAGTCAGGFERSRCAPCTAPSRIGLNFSRWCTACKDRAALPADERLTAGHPTTLPPMDFWAPLETEDPEIAQVVRDEEARTRAHLELIASENYPSLAVLQAMGTVLT